MRPRAPCCRRHYRHRLAWMTMEILPRWPEPVVHQAAVLLACRQPDGTGTHRDRHFYSSRALTKLAAAAMASRTQLNSVSSTRTHRPATLPEPA